MKAKPLIGIIGGTGILGTLFGDFFKSQGYEVLISGRRTELTSVDLVKKCDVVVFSVPIDVTKSVIEKVLPYTREDQLLMDFTSIKQEPVETMLKGEASVIGLHPLFGRVESLEGKTIIVVPARPGGWQSWVLSIFKKANLKIKVSDAERHDKLMAALQGLMYFNFIVFGKVLGDVLKRFDITFEEISEYGGVIYQMRFGMIARLLSQDPELHGSIQMKNESSKEIIKYYEEAVEELSQIVREEKKEDFVDYFKEAGEVFGEDFREKSLKESTELIEYLSKRNKDEVF